MVGRAEVHTFQPVGRDQPGQTLTQIVKLQLPFHSSICLCLRRLLDAPETSWSLLEPRESSWNILWPLGASWNILDAPGTSWSLQKALGGSRSLLEPPGAF